MKNNRQAFSTRDNGFALMFNNYTGLDKCPKSVVKQIIAKTAQENPDLDPTKFGVFMGKIVHYTGKKDPNAVVPRAKRAKQEVGALLPTKVKSAKCVDNDVEKWVPLDLTGTNCGKKYKGLVEQIKQKYTISNKGNVRFGDQVVKASMHNKYGDMSTAQVHLGKYCCPTLRTCMVAAFTNATGDKDYATKMYEQAIANLVA